MDLSRIDRIKKMGFDPHTVYYHGTGHVFDNFDTRSHGAFGHGIYLSTDPFTAEKYAMRNAPPSEEAIASYKASYGDQWEPDNKSDTSPRIIPAHIKGNKPILVGSTSTKFTASEMYNLLKNHPNKNSEEFNSFIHEHSSVSGNMDDKIRSVSENLSHIPAVRVFDQCHRSNLYGEDPYHEIIHSEITKHTGYDHIIVDQSQDPEYPEKWAVMWHPHQVRGIHAKFEKEHSNDLMEDIRVKAGKFVVKEIVKYFVKKEIEKKKEELKQKIFGNIFGNDSDTDDNDTGYSASGIQSPPPTNSTSNFTPVVRVVHKSRPIHKMKAHKMRESTEFNGVTEDAPAANVVANIPTTPVVSIVNQQRIVPKIRKNKLLDVDNDVS